jgi:hypothetical protein
MFFLIDQAVPFAITFPAQFQVGVNMNEALRQPIEFTQPKVIKYSLPFVFMQLAPPVYLANGLPVSNPTSTTTSDIGVGRTSTEPV